jgi:hypothetical protein
MSTIQDSFQGHSNPAALLQQLIRYYVLRLKALLFLAM